LTKLNRRIVGGSGYSKEFDGDRVYNIIFETAGNSWEDYDPAVQWQNVDPLLTWQTVDILIGNIDRPGDFELRDYSDGEGSGLNLAQQAAASGLGILYECNLGRICYDDYTSRTDDAALNGFVHIDLNAILANNLSSVSRLADLANDVEVTYKNNQSERAQNESSVALYGLYSAKVDTLLENDYDAENRVAYYLDTRSFPRKELNKLSLILHLDSIDNDLRDDLIPMRVSLPIRIEGLPESVYAGNFIGFVEGFTWTINRNELFLTLNVSEYGFSQIQMNWLQVPPTIEWQDVSATLEWQEARVVA